MSDAPPTAILFDVDGTLVDSNRQHIAAWLTIFAEVGHPQSWEAVAGQIGKGGDQLVPALLPDLPEAEHKRIAALHGPLFLAHHLASVRPLPGARELLARTKAAGLQVVLATSSKAEQLALLLKPLDADAFIDVRTTADDAERTKPAPDIFAAALKKIGLRAENACVVGDTPYDMAAARACGIVAVGLLTGGFGADALVEGGAAAIYADPSALLAGFDASPLANASSRNRRSAAHD